MNDISAGYAELPRTAFLDHTLRRARSAAEQRSHRYVTLEHLLFALLDDPDAVRLLQGVGADIAVIRSAISDGVNHRMASLVVPDGRAPSFSYKFDTLILKASEDAMKLGRRDVDGALTLIAVAKDPESNASAILAANGFDPSAALHHLGGPSVGAQREFSNSHAPQYRSEPVPPPIIQSSRQPHHKSPGGNPPASDDNMEDMLASVRNILEAEERRERGLSPTGPSVIAQPHVGNYQARLEPQLRAEVQRGQPDARASAAYQSRDRVEPSLGQEYVHQRPPFNQPEARFEEPPPPSSKLETQRAKPEKKRKGGKNRAETPALVTKILERLPRRARVAVAETAEILITKEETAAIFGRSKRRGQAQDHEEPSACRAVTVRLSAPEGGFFIESSTPETQWIFDRPSFLGDEAFGRWAWMLIPNESGAFNLTVQISVRDIDENGLAGDFSLADQVIGIRIRGNFWRGIGRILRTVFILLAGSGLTVGAYYGLKMMGKIPH